jgi:hypothetical protein
VHRRRGAAVLAVAATIIGWPARILSDNATAFRHTLATALAALGVGAGHSRPYHPQTCGKVERFHQTLKKWLAARPRATTIEELQAQLDLFRLYYNHHRPHRALDRRHPADAWADAPKSGPTDRPITTPTAVYHSTVHGGTCYTGRYNISVGARHNGPRAVIVITGTACHVFIDGHLTRQLTLNPTRRVQPIYNRKGRPTNTDRRTAPTSQTMREDPRHA